MSKTKELKVASTIMTSKQYKKALSKMKSNPYSGKFRVVVMKENKTYAYRFYANTFEEAEMLFDWMNKTHPEKCIYLSALRKDARLDLETYVDLKGFRKVGGGRYTKREYFEAIEFRVAE
jgi:hypothetical protein